MAPTQALSNSLEKICLSSIGNGKVTQNQNNYPFSFESLSDPLEKSWALSINIPLHGEEILRLNYKNILEDRFVISGNLYAKLMVALEKKGATSSIQMVNSYLKNMAIFLNFYQERALLTKNCTLDFFDEYEASGVCSINDAKKTRFKWKLKNDIFTLSTETKLKKGQRFLLKFYGTKNKIFENTYSETMAVNENDAEQSLSLFLKTDECLAK